MGQPLTCARQGCRTDAIGSRSLGKVPQNLWLSASDLVDTTEQKHFDQPQGCSASNEQDEHPFNSQKAQTLEENEPIG